MSKKNEVITNMKSGYRCSESILVTYCEEFGLSKQMAMRLGCSLGGGLGSTGGVCGAVSAAVLVIGLKFGRTDLTDRDSVAITDKHVAEFLSRFEEANQSSLCNELIGFDRRVESDHIKAKEEGIYKSICPGLVETAATILEDILYRG